MLKPLSQLASSFLCTFLGQSASNLDESKSIFFRYYTPPSWQKLNVELPLHDLIIFLFEMSSFFFLLLLLLSSSYIFFSLSFTHDSISTPLLFLSLSIHLFLPFLSLLPPSRTIFQSLLLIDLVGFSEDDACTYACV